MDVLYFLTFFLLILCYDYVTYKKTTLLPSALYLKVQPELFYMEEL